MKITCRLAKNTRRHAKNPHAAPTCQKHAPTYQKHAQTCQNRPAEIISRDGFFHVGACFCHVGAADPPCVRVKTCALSSGQDAKEATPDLFFPQLSVQESRKKVGAKSQDHPYTHALPVQIGAYICSCPLEMLHQSCVWKHATRSTDRTPIGWWTPRASGLPSMVRTVSITPDTFRESSCAQHPVRNVSALQCSCTFTAVNIVGRPSHAQHRTP